MTPKAAERISKKRKFMLHGNMDMESAHVCVCVRERETERQREREREREREMIKEIVVFILDCPSHNSTLTFVGKCFASNFLTLPVPFHPLKTCLVVSVQ